MSSARLSGTHLGEQALDIDNMKYFHPHPDNHGNMVPINHPSIPSSVEAFTDPQQIAVVVPEGKTPSILNHIALTIWDSPPGSLAEWANIIGQAEINEPPIKPMLGKKLSAGVVTIEPDGRFWLVAPTNAFGGYKVTFPKGTIDAGTLPKRQRSRKPLRRRVYKLRLPVGSAISNVLHR